MASSEWVKSAALRVPQVKTGSLAIVQKGGRSVSVVLDSEPADVEVSAVVGAWLSVVTAGAELTGVAEDIPAGAGAAVLVEEVLFLLTAAGMRAVVFTVVFVISVVVVALAVEMLGLAIPVIGGGVDDIPAPSLDV